MTAYIKMIDVWMIVMMLYPFLVVSLYTVMEVMKNSDNKIQVSKGPEEWVVREDRSMKIVTHLLELGLPILMTFFLIVYCALGLQNAAAIHVNDLC